MQAIYIDCYSSLLKIDSWNTSQYLPIEDLTGFSGETISFQVSLLANQAYTEDFYTCLEIDCPGCSVSTFRVESIPCTYPCNPTSTGAYLTREPALIPDALIPFHGEPVRISASRHLIFWVDIAIPENARNTTVSIRAFSRKNVLQSILQLPLNVIGVPLPAQSVRHSEWLHCDCLCQEYACEMFSETFWQILKSYLLEAVSNGIDTLLTPVITPSLDIEPGYRRLPCQLVTIQRNSQGFHYDFTRLERWVSLATECGIQYFEIAPFFTQWGAKFAAEIYEQTADGNRTLFGWDTPAFCDAYRNFLSDFLPALKEELTSLHVLSKTYFHISDEPTAENLENYRAARQMIAPYLEGCHLIDALSDHIFLEQNLVSIPVVSEDHLSDFLPDAKNREVWTYCCCAQDKLVPNFFLSMPSTRGRILGVLMYLEGIRGFLHWGYNFWNSQFSKNPIDPYRITDADGGFPSGDAFLVYPGADGTPVPSIRLKTMRDAFQDYRALSALEALAGREAVLRLVSDTLGDISFSKYPTDIETYLLFRSRLCCEIQQFSHKQ